MSDNYEQLAMKNLEQLFRDPPPDLAGRLGAEKTGKGVRFPAFGEVCTITPAGIRVGSGGGPSVIKLLISLYALHANPEELVLEPFRGFRELPDSAPYAAAFSANAEQVLAPRAEVIKAGMHTIKERMEGMNAPHAVSGDFAFVLRPLPKIALCYIFYEADEDFPASATCLFSSNARTFLPVDALADVAEHTSGKILAIAAS
jgi:hypothetical protein